MERRVMRKAVWSAIATVGAVVLFSTSAYAQTTATGSVTVTVNVNARARLTLGAAAITFADADPDTQPTMNATPLSVSVGARTAPTGNVTLTVVATGDLASGTDTIGIGNLTWSATGTGFVAGTSNSTTAQSVGAWTGPGNRNGTQTYSLPNSWAYATGTYTTTLNYTLTVP
jgi:hypothetical protein